MRTLRVESIELKNVGPFQDFRLELPPVVRDDIAEVHVLTGPNGSGKSTLLHAIAGCLVRAAQDSLHARFSRAAASALIAINGDHRSFNIGYPAPPVWPQAGSNELLRALYRALESGVPEAKVAAFHYAGTRQLPHSTAITGGSVSKKPLSGAMDASSSVDAQALLDWICDNRVRAALASQEHADTEARNYQENINTVTRILSDITEQTIEFEIGRLDFEVRLKQTGQSPPIGVLPDGLKSLIAWIGDLMRRLEGVGITLGCAVNEISFILLLDEIDIHLHPRWQRRVLPAIQKAFPRAQIIVSTHSPFVVGSIADAWVYRLDPADTHCEPIASGAGESIATILEDVFGISEIFDPETHRLFQAFYSARKSILEGGEIELIEGLARQLSARGEEVQDIVSRELAQLKRLTGKKISHAQV